MTSAKNEAPDTLRGCAHARKVWYKFLQQMFAFGNFFNIVKDLWKFWWVVTAEVAYMYDAYNQNNYYDLGYSTGFIMATLSI